MHTRSHLTRILAAVALALALIACQPTIVMPPVDAPPVAVAPTPTEPAPPAPVPVDVFAPIGTCAILVTILEAPPTPQAATNLNVRLEPGCNLPVPALIREQVTHDRDRYINMFEGVLYPGRGFGWTIPYSQRGDRFEVVDLRDGRVYPIQNGQHRTPLR